MKRIEFIAPVEAMRGNLSGAQKLQYPTDNQGAYEGPAGAVNYARNYSPRFIGAKIAKSGKKYFSVRTKTANHLTVKSKQAMALMGGTGAIVASILRDKTAEIYTNLYGAWVKAQELGGSTSTFRQFLSGSIRRMLIQKSATYHVQVGEFGQDIDNPWNTTKPNPNVSISQAILVKFWGELAAKAIVIDVEGLKLIAHSDDTFQNVIESGYNVMNLKALANVPGAVGGITTIVTADSTADSGKRLGYVNPITPGTLGWVEASNKVSAYYGPEAFTLAFADYSK